MKKASHCQECEQLEQIPNVGKACAEDLRLLSIHKPQDLRGRDAFSLYQQLCTATGQRHDPCVLDTLMAVVDFMSGGPPRPWWHFTPERKALYKL
ncbi:MAG: helix-hairpin-helix domain-containing protein [Paucibacter sp.]|nr:helix-hairpin-helix domain-containing protein [Roseateles sp.]